MTASDALLLATAIVVPLVCLGAWIRGWFARKEIEILKDDLDLAQRRVRQLEKQLVRMERELYRSRSLR